MKVKDIVSRALRYAGREEVARKLDAGIDLDAEEAEATKTMLYCFNAIEDELAKNYLTLTTTETLKNGRGRYDYTAFRFRPLKILSVKSGGREIDYVLELSYLQTSSAMIEVRYEYAPTAQDMTGDSAFSEAVAPVKLIAYGTASEYCLINGQINLAEYCEAEYRRQLDLTRKRAVAGVRFPPRRWV